MLAALWIGRCYDSEVETKTWSIGTEMSWRDARVLVDASDLGRRIRTKSHVPNRTDVRLLADTWKCGEDCWGMVGFSSTRSWDERWPASISHDRDLRPPRSASPDRHRKPDTSERVEGGRDIPG